MKSSTYWPLAAKTTTCNSTTSQTIALPNQCAAFLISVATTNAYMTFDGTAPSSTNGLTFIAATNPSLVLVGNGATLTFLATAAGSSVVNVVPLQG